MSVSKTLLLLACWIVCVAANYDQSVEIVSSNGTVLDWVVLSDVFKRADTAPGMLGTAESGQTWNLSGALAGQAQISNHAITALTGASGPFYAYINLSGTIVAIGAKLTWVAGSGSAGTIGGFEVIAADGVGGLLNHMIHSVNLGNAMPPFITWWNGASQNNAVSGCTWTSNWPAPKAGDVWDVSVTRTGATDYHYTQTNPDGSVSIEDCIGDPHVAQLWASGIQPIWEAGSQVQTALVPTFSQVWADKLPGS